MEGLSGDSLALLPMMFRVRLGGLRSMVRGVMQMSLRCMRMVGGQFVISRFMVLRGFAMVSSRMFVVFSCRLMMLCCLLGHLSSLSSR
jgi:hypothetical protein